MASCIHYAHPCMFRMFLNICTHAVSNNFSLLWIYTAWLRVHSFSICKCQLPEDPHTAEPDDAINSIILNQRFVLSSLTRNYFGANPSLLSEQNLWPHMLCSGQHQTFNCVWVKKTLAQGAPLYHMIFDGLGGMNKSGCILPRSWDEFYVFVCFFCALPFEREFFITLLCFPVSKKNSPTSGNVRGKGLTSQMGRFEWMSSCFNLRPSCLFPCIKNKWFLQM